MASIGTDRSSFAIGYTFPVIGAICVVLRFYSRRYLKHDLRLDDWLVLPAWLCTTGCCTCLLIRAYRDQAPDLDERTQQQFEAQILGALALFWSFANTCIKSSILFFYRRVFVGRWFNIYTRMLIGLSIIWLVYQVTGWLLYCGTDLRANFEGPWDNCPIWGFQLQIGVFALDSFIDLCILIVPIPVIWQLQLNAAKKMFASLIFVLGAFAFFAGLSNTIVQGVFLVQPDFAEKSSGGGFFHGASVLIYNWPAIEVGVGLIACNLPSISFRVLASLPTQVRSIWSSSVSKLRERSSARSSGSASQAQGRYYPTGSQGADNYELQMLGSNKMPSVHTNVSASA